MIEVDAEQLRQARVALDAHRYTLDGSALEEQLRQISMLLSNIHTEVKAYDYVILKQKKGGISDKGRETGPNPESSS